MRSTRVLQTFPNSKLDRHIANNARVREALVSSPIWLDQAHESLPISHYQVLSPAGPSVPHIAVVTQGWLAVLNDTQGNALDSQSADCRLSVSQGN